MACVSGFRWGAGHVFRYCYVFISALLPLFLGGAVHAGAQAGTNPARIKVDLDRILSRPEFLPETQGEGPFTRVLRWIGEHWDRFWKWLRDLFPSMGGIAAGGGGKVLLWIFIVLFVVLGAWLLAKLIRSYLDYRAGRQPQALRPNAAYDIDDPAMEGVTDPDVWLQQAQRYAADGDYRRAFRAVFLAVLMHLDRAGAIEYDRARTNGDYLRTLRSKGLGPLYEVIRPLAAEFDSRWYGSRTTGENDYRRCREMYDRVRQLSAAAASAEAARGPALAAGRG